MAERIVFSTQDLALASIYNQQSFEFGDQIIIAEDVSFGMGRDGGAGIFEDKATGRLLSLDHVIYDLGKHMAVYYDHNYWTTPFGVGFEPHPNNLYKAVIHLSSVAKGKDNRLIFAVNYGTFWYDQRGCLKAVEGGSITQKEYESVNAPTLKFRRLPSDNWQVFRLSGIEEPSMSYFLEGKTAKPECLEVLNGQEREFDEMVISLTDDGEWFRFHQRALGGHKEKTIKVPSKINISQWVLMLNTLDGGWTQALSEFPTGIELVA